MKSQTTKYFLWNAVAGEFDSDWHDSEGAAILHKIDCALSTSWRVIGLTDAQISALFA
jgi:hypothetical protein